MKIKFLIFAFIFLAFFSCKKDPTNCGEMTTTYKYLTPVSLERTSYFTDPTFDTIKFRSNKGDTLIFVKTDCDTTWFDDYKSWNNPDCGPYENVKNMQITNSYQTVKGEGDFKVKHSLSTRTEYDGNTRDYIIEIQFLKYHFYFSEIVFEDIYYKRYLGNLEIDDFTFNHVFYEYHIKNPNFKAIGCMSPSFGLVAVNDSINLNTYEIIM